MGAGDIDADPDQVGTDDLATSEILLQAMPATVFTAGDNQYPWGQIEDFQDPNGYSGTWGRGPLKAITCATVGNHEYLDPEDRPGRVPGLLQPQLPPPARRRVRQDLGRGDHRHRLRLPARPGSGAHMAAHPARCRLAIWHHPRWISGDARADEDVRVYELYNVSAYQGRISLILNGHSHSYQRFASMLADGRLDPTYRAPRSITVGGAGGRPGAGSSTMGP
jgi:acid phosphatase type 7